MDHNRPPKDTRFQPFQSGNAAERKPGTRNRMTILAEQIVADRIGRIADTATAKAEAGDSRLCEFFLSRAIARPRGQPVERDLPKTDTPERVVGAGVARLRAAPDGGLTPDEAQSLGALLESRLGLADEEAAA